MNNLLAGTGIGTIFVDHQLRTLRFTPTVSGVINLIPSDVGRPLAHIVSNLVGYDSLVEDVQAVLHTLVPREVEVRTRTGAWYSLRIRPYRTLDNVIEGAVITFIDITDIALARRALREGETMRRLAVVVRDARDAVMMHDLSGAILAWNPGAERLYGWSEAEALAMNLRDLSPDGEREPVEPLRRDRSQEQGTAPLRATRLCKDGRVMAVLVTAAALVNNAGDVYAVATTERAVEGAGP
jgi:two-component system CheB/CheR fusion protein